MNVQTFAAVLCIIVLYALYKRLTAADSEPEEPQEEYDAAELIDAIRALYALTFKLENADRMLADLASCDPAHLLRNFKTEWCGIDGKQRTIDFIADGDNKATAGLLSAAHEHRDAINAEIISSVRAMNAALDSGGVPALHLDAVGGTVDETTETRKPGEW